MRFAHGFKTSAPAAPRLPRLRAPLVFGGLLLLFIGLLGRSLYLQRIDNGFLQEQGSSRYSRDIEVPAHRGRIVDRFGDPLAISTPVKAVWALPDQVDATPEQLKALAAALDLPTSSLKQKLAQGGDFVYLKKPVAPQAAAHIAALKIDGIHDENEYWRYYPGGEVMSQIVGFTGDRDVGQEGIELAQQSWLGGHPGSRRVIINRRGEIVEDVASIRAPQEGRDLALSIDSRLQYLAFRELKAAVEANKARAGALVMLDAKTGEILALANWPAFNPNNRQRTARDHMRNRALIDTFEPGSTLKPFTVAAALDAGKVNPQTIIDTAPGTLTIGGATIHDAHREGALTVEQVIQKSSNVGAAKIALSLPAETMWHMLSGAGFGAQPRTGFPGEVSGRLRAAKTWRPIEQATMAYGHGISVNLVQLARAYTIFASDGELKPVSLLKVDGTVAGRPVITPQTARAVRHMLEMVVQPGGTAPKAQISGYRVAGKTGTAHKLDGRVYGDKYVSSFVGFAPVSNPRLIVAVMLDEPGAGQYYGGTVAAPVFAEVMGGALRLLGVAPDAPANTVVLPSDAVAVREET
ncbi:MAG TPA: penicillin-binding transpeptidase domain-containing protein [Casimicrobiaceae bacterium]|nr:penicillin-binding transpeptidase domain-containing protein [Casimicrobiaceae bacterium]